MVGERAVFEFPLKELDLGELLDKLLLEELGILGANDERMIEGYLFDSGNQLLFRLLHRPDVFERAFLLESERRTQGLAGRGFL